MEHMFPDGYRWLQGDSLRERRVRSSNTWWAENRSAEAEARRREKKRDRAAAHDAEVASGSWMAREELGPKVVNQDSETAEIRFEHAPSIDSATCLVRRGTAPTLLGLPYLTPVVARRSRNPAGCGEPV